MHKHLGALKASTGIVLSTLGHYPDILHPRMVWRAYSNQRALPTLSHVPQRAAAPDRPAHALTSYYTTWHATMACERSTQPAGTSFATVDDGAGSNATAIIAKKEIAF